MKKPTIAFIYALADPTNDRVRYVGQTVDIVARLQRHYYEARRAAKSAGMSGHLPRNKWLRGILAAGNEPILYILEVVPYNQRRDTERHWIAVLRNANELLNASHGGDGPDFHLRGPRTSAQKTLHSMTLRRLYATGEITQWSTGLTAATDHRIRRSAEKRRGGVRSEASRAKMRRASQRTAPAIAAKLRGRTAATHPYLAEKAARQRGKPLSESHRAALSRSHKGKVPWNKGLQTGQVPWNKGTGGSA